MDRLDDNPTKAACKKKKNMWKNKGKISQNPEDVKKVETINCQTLQKTQGRTKKYSLLGIQVVIGESNST